MSIRGRFLSLEYIGRRAAETARRFPYTLVSGAVAAAAAIRMIELDNFAPTPGRLLLVGLLGIPVFTALAIFAERRPWSTTLKRWFPAAGILLLGGYYLALPQDVTYPALHIIRFALLILASHFLVAVLPFAGAGDRIGFWQYNKSLFLRLLLAHIYMQVLFAGLALALVAADQLFGLEVNPKRYAELGMLIAGVFQTWVFLAGVPTDLEALNRSSEYPAGLKVFTQFILLPLVSLYFLILITYEFKILATWNWPEGWVAYLVLWFSVVGILSLLLLHPLQTQEGSRWIAAFGTWFFRGMVPLLGMLYFAIYQRIAEYGITVNRYFVVAMAVGLTLVVLYFVIARSRDIRAIPATLCLLCLLSAFGPLSAFAVAERSQRSRLADYMARNTMATGSVASPAPGAPSEVDRREMSSIVDYLLEFHGPRAFRDWADPELLARIEKDGHQEWSDSLAADLGFVYQAGWRRAEGHGYFYFSADDARRQPLPLAGWTHLVDYSYSGAEDSVRAFALGSDSVFVRLDSASLVLTLAVGADRTVAGPAAKLSLADRITQLQTDFGDSPIDPARLAFSSDPGGPRSEWHFQRISGSREDGHTRIEHVRARILIGSDGS